MRSTGIMEGKNGEDFSGSGASLPGDTGSSRIRSGILKRLCRKEVGKL